MSRSNPRTVCIEALSRWESERKFADELLHEAFATHDLSPLDRGFLTEAFYGIIRNLAKLDFIISRFREESVDSNTRQVLRLGFYQLYHMRIPHHAAVNETVNLAGKARGLVNALLRRGIREHEDVQRAIENAPASIRFSHPAFLVQRWEKHFGVPDADRLCEWNNGNSEIYVRANGLKTSTEELLKEAPDSALSPAHPLSIKVPQIPHEWMATGRCYVQDPSTLISCDLLAPQPGDHVLDACAAPGGKTTYIAQMMKNTGFIAACDTSQHRLKRLAENLVRLGVTCAKVTQANWPNDSQFSAESFDSILLDAPCSNTGVIRRRVDVRWRLTPEDFSKMHEIQFGILNSLVPLLKKGGTIVYSTCSVEAEENEQIITRAARELPQLRFIESRSSIPFRDQADGAFAAKFERID